MTDKYETMTIEQYRMPSGNYIVGIRCADKWYEAAEIDRPLTDEELKGVLDKIFARFQAKIDKAFLYGIEEEGDDYDIE